MKPTDGYGQYLDELLEREWLIANRLGGYASSTIPGLNTRKYHGLLVAAMSPPVRRVVLLSRVEEVVRCNGWPTPLACNEYPGAIHPRGHEALAAFSPAPFPRWAYQGDGWTLEKSLQLIRGENTVVLSYTLIGARDPVELELRPLLALRPIHDLMYQWNGQLAAEEKRIPVARVSNPCLESKTTIGKCVPRNHRMPPTRRTPEVFFAHDGTFETSHSDDSAGTWYFNTIYRREQDRGYAGLEDLWSPGTVKWKLSPGQAVHFACSADPIDFERAIAAADAECLQLDSPLVDLPARDTDHDLLVRAAETFVIDLPGENGMPSIGQPIGLLTKLPWGAPSAHDALIALPGLLLVTGRFDAARSLLLSLASRLRNGLIPTEIAEDATRINYNGADTSLWFTNAIWQYLRYTGDEAAACKLLEPASEIIRNYQRGTELGIAAQPSGLLASRSPGCGTSWMDAKVGDWVITQRGGMPVELNALWYNAVRIVASLAARFDQPRRADELDALASTISRSFNATFWNAAENCCFDVVDGNRPDASIRPNQLLAVSLPFAALAIERHIPVVEKVRRELITPMGPRTLSPRDPTYQGRYGGDAVARDRALHQGCVHPWLLGQFITAQTRAFGRGPAVREEAKRLLRGPLDHIRRGGLGQICELFDGDLPHRPGGAIACATAAGELLRAYVEDVLDLNPASALAAKLQATITISPKIAAKK